MSRCDKLIRLSDIYRAPDEREDETLLRIYPRSGWLTFNDDSSYCGITEITFGEFEDACGRAAWHILNMWDLKPGMCLVVSAAKDWRVLALLGGCIFTGVIFVPVSPKATHTEVTHVLTTLRTKDQSMVTFVSEEPLEAGGIQRLTSDIGFLNTHESMLDPLSVDPEKTAAIIFTSGTTMQPKGVMLSGRAMLTNARALVGVWGITEQDILIHCLPLNHIHGLLISFHVALAAGCSVSLYPRFSTEALRCEGGTVFMGVPTMYRKLLDDPSFVPARSLRLCICGSAPLLPSMWLEFEARTGFRIVQRYGMTETGVIASHSPWSADSEGVGRPLPCFEVKMTNGEICVRGTSMFSGYWPNVFRIDEDGFFPTGDLAALHHRDYSNIVIQGRLKDIIISGGVNVSPAAVENVIAPFVQDVAVVGVPHHYWGEAVVAFVEGDCSIKDIEEVCATQLSAEWRPKLIQKMDKLPYNTMGKVLKSDLRKSYEDLFRSQESMLESVDVSTIA